MSAAPLDTILELLLLVSVALPVLLSLIWPFRRARPWIVALAPWAASPSLLLALLHLSSSGSGPSVEWTGLSMGVRLGLDDVGGAFLLLTALLWVAAGAFASRYHAADERRDRFFGFFTLTMAGNLGLVMAGSLTTFYFGFAVMTFSAYGLVAHRREEAARRAGRVYIVMALMGEAALLTGLLTLGAAAGGGVEFGAELDAGWAALAEGFPDSWAPAEVLGSRSVIAALLVVGFGVKVGIVPLHLWLPLAHPVAPTAASALLSAVMIEAGVLGWLRVLPRTLAVPDPGMALLIVGIVSAFYGVIVGLAQDDPKTLLAYSSVSQMGYLAMGTGILMIAPNLSSVALAAVLVFVLHHGVAKGALFLSVGVAGALPRLEGDRRGDAARGGSASVWWRRVLLGGAALPALALAGAPFTSGARAKETLKHALSRLGGDWYAALDPLLLAAAVGTTLLMIRFLVLLGRATAAPEGTHGNRGAGPWGLAIPWGGLVVVGVLAPIWIGWAFPGARVVELPGLADTVLSAAWPVLLGSALAAWALRGRAFPRTIRELRCPPGDLLVPIQAALDRISLVYRERSHRRVQPSLRLPARIQEVAGRLTDALAERDLPLMRGLTFGSLMLALVAVLMFALVL